MNLLQDIVTYVRRIIKSPSNAVITDALIIDYINRFWIMDVDARVQLFDLKTKYQFQTVPGYDQYNMPMYQLQTEPGPQTISYYPVYQGFLDPVYINGIQVPFQTDKTTFFNIWPNIVQQMNASILGNGGATYSFTFPIAPNNIMPITTPFQYILRGHVDMNGIIALANSAILGAGFLDPPLVTPLQGLLSIPVVPVANVFPAVYITTNLADGTSVVVTDSGQFLNGNQNFGLLMSPGSFPTGNLALAGGYSTTSNTINYFTGQVNVTFPDLIPAGVNINAQCFLFQCGLPRGVLFNNNTLTFRSPPDQQYLVEIDAYLSPAGFLATNQAIQFGYMCEYIARGAARKILSDTGDVEQFQFYEPLFREQEQLVWKRSQRQFTASRTQTIYSQGINQGQSGFNNLGGSTL
jgi:hypothetical protein